MKKTQISTSVPPRTRKQADRLVREHYGTLAAVLIVAIDRLYREETKMFIIDDQKLAQVTEIINRDTDPAATTDLIRTEICADWNEGTEHQEWIDAATPEEIADWIASFYQES